MPLTLEQQKVLALAKARKRKAESQKGSDWRRGALAPVERNEQTGELRWAVPQIALDAWDAVKLPSDALQGKVQPGTDEWYRRGANFGMTFTPSTVPTNGPMLVDGKKLPKVLAKGLADDGIDPRNLGGVVKEMGEGAMVADVSPSTQALTSAMATTQGVGQKTVVDALRNRAKGAASRITSAADSALGPAMPPSRLQETLKAGKTLLGGQYDEAFAASGGNSGAASLAKSLDASIARLRGPAQKKLMQIRKDLNVVGKSAVDENPRTLFEVRQAVDGMLSTETDPKVIGVLSNARAQIDDLLGQSVPGIKNVDAQFTELAKQDEAFAFGGKSLAGGKTTPRPSDFAEAVIAGSQPQGPQYGPSAATYRMRQGIRNEIDRLVGTKVNDRQALKQAVTADGKWNYEKLSSIIGPEKAGKLVRLLENEMRQYQTEQAALYGSKTAAVRAAQEKLMGKDAAGVLKNAANLQFGDAAGGVLDAIIGPLKGRRQQTLAEILMSKGNVQQVPSATPIPTLALLGAELKRDGSGGGGF